MFRPQGFLEGKAGQSQRWWLILVLSRVQFPNSLGMKEMLYQFNCHQFAMLLEHQKNKQLLDEMPFK
jgi:hypothetical protein